MRWRYGVAQDRPRAKTGAQQARRTYVAQKQLTQK
jgi:hypothetical protein